MAKSRLGFVSNSSSSSFIVSVDNDKDKIMVEIDFIEFVKHCTENCYTVIKTKEELIDYYFGQYCWYNDENKDKSKEELLNIEFETEEHDYGYHDSLKQIDKGKVVIVAEVDNDKDEIFDNVVEKSEIKLIDKGY